MPFAERLQELAGYAYAIAKFPLYETLNANACK
jgi:hypothetical protein